MDKERKYAMAEAVRAAYRQGEDDETLEPRVLVDGGGRPLGRLGSGDGAIFYDLRGEREVELCRSLLDEEFPHFPVADNLDLDFVTMIPYHPHLKARPAFVPAEEVRDTLGETLARHGLRQVKISESEKAIHVSYFLNGKARAAFPGEERVIVPSPKGVAFDRAPEMNAAGVADQAAQAMADPKGDFILANFANVDVVGHMENERAIIRAAEAVDFHLGRCLQEARRAGLTALVSADHGTVEKWLYPDGSIDTGHTDSPVPFILFDPREGNRSSWKLRARGELADIAPTVLEILDLPRPRAMSGRSLLAAPPPVEKGRRRLLLIILDGWGVGSDSQGNLIRRARTPVMDDLWAKCPASILEASGEAVGLPAGTVGNSEAGHLHIGAGRRIPSDRLLIDRALADGTFFHNEAILRAMNRAKAGGRSLHLLGIVSFFSSHGSIAHLLALLRMAKREGLEGVFIHSLLGRRGEHRESGARYMEMVEKEAETLALGRVVSVIGRHWALDREENWDRIEKTYRLLVWGEGIPVPEQHIDV